MVPVVVACVLAPDPLVKMIGDGELLLISCTLCAVAIGEFHTAHSEFARTPWATLAGGISTAVILGAALLYAKLKTLSTAQVQANFQPILWLTVVMVSCCLVSSTGCIIASKLNSKAPVAIEGIPKGFI